MQHFDEYDDDDDDFQHASEQQWSCSLCNFRNCSFMPHCEICSLRKGAKAPEVSPAVVKADDATHGIRPLLLGGHGRLSQHQAAFRAHPQIYEAELRHVLELGVAIQSGNRARIAATLAAESRHSLVATMLDEMSIAEVLSFVKFLDAPRKVRQWRRRIKRFEAGKQRVLKATKASLRSKIAIAESEVLQGGNVSGSLARRIRAKVRTSLSAEKLEFFLLQMPTQVWKDLADIVHFKPKDFQLDYFLPCVFGAPAPEGSLVADLRALAETAEGAAAVGALIRKHPNLKFDYSYLRRKFAPESAAPLPAAVRLQLARMAPLEDVLWYYHEFEAPGVENAVDERLRSGESLDAGRGRTNFGKLMERLILFRSRNLKFVPALMTYAEEKLRSMKKEASRGEEDPTQAVSAAVSPKKENKGGRVAVLGDASGSMEVAINTATILGSLLSVCLDADLRFFNERAFAPPLVPASAAEVLGVTEQVPATGVTAPAAALRPYFKEAPVDLFVVVSDEEENTPDPDTGKTFAELFSQYRAEVNPRATVFLVSFISGPSSFLGKMNATLRVQGIVCRQFRLAAARPDLSKLASLLALLKLELNPGMALPDALSGALSAADEAAKATSKAAAAAVEEGEKENKKKGGAATAKAATEVGAGGGA